MEIFDKKKGFVTIMMLLLQNFKASYVKINDQSHFTIDIIKWWWPPISIKYINCNKVLWHTR